MRYRPTRRDFCKTAVLSLTTPVLAGVTAARAQPNPKLPPISELRPQRSLPDPLTMLDGRRVLSRRQWETERRPELKLLFQHYMYGYLPDAPRTRATVEWEDREALGGTATLRDVTLRFGPEGTPPLSLLVAIPNQRQGPAPVFLGLNFCGNHATLDHPRVRIPDSWVYAKYPGVVNNRATEAGRGKQKELWNIEESIRRGYSVATFYNGDVDPDFPDFSNGVHPHFEKKRNPHSWGTVAAWAWGFHRAVDYLTSDPDIDDRRIAAVGHSRNGKAALVAAAFDERIALAIPHQAGCGGTAPSRGKIGESVQRINTSFPHWFNDQFKAFNERPELLPFDQNCLVALVAPRPVLFSNAQDDAWANPEGQFEVLRAADPVYRMLGTDGLGATVMPPFGKVIDSHLGYFIRPGKHSMTREDWEAFWTFADRHFEMNRGSATQ